MITNLHVDTLLPSLFETTVKAFKSGAKEIGNSILMNVIFSMKQTDNDFKKLREDIEKDAEYALKLDNEEFHDTLLDLEDFLERQIIKAQEHKDDSEIFNEYYKVLKSIHKNVSLAGIELSEKAAHALHEKKIAS